MTTTRTTLGDFLQQTRVLFAQCRKTPGVTEVLAQFGYDTHRLAQGVDLLNDVEALALRQRREFGDQSEGTVATMTAWELADQAYGKTLRIARLAFVDDAHAFTALKLGSHRKASLAGWLDQAKLFYGNLLNQPRLIEALGRFGYTPWKIETEASLVAAVDVLVWSRAQATGESPRCVQDRDNAIKALDTWVGEFRTVLKVAFSEDPRALEALGLRFGCTPGRTRRKGGSGAGPRG